MDREERSNFEYFSVNCHLPDNLRVSLGGGNVKKFSTCSRRSSFDAGFLTLSQMRSGAVVREKIYRVLPRHYQEMALRLAGKMLNSRWVKSSVCACSLISWMRPYMTLRVSTAVVRASSCVSRSSLCRIDPKFFSPNSFFTTFSAVHSVMLLISGEETTHQIFLA